MFKIKQEIDKILYYRINLEDKKYMVMPSLPRPKLIFRTENRMDALLQAGVQLDSKNIIQLSTYLNIINLKTTFKKYFQKR